MNTTIKTTALFSEKNEQQIKARGLSQDKIIKQLDIFKNGIPFMEIVAPASVSNGINLFSSEQQQHYAQSYEVKRKELQVMKFVPASGAATRMFQFLHNFLDIYDPTTDFQEYLQNPENRDLNIFFGSFSNFAFADLVESNLSLKNPNWKSLSEGEKAVLIVKEMLDESGLNYSNTPKGLIPFHKTKDSYITAFGEQLLEAAHYAATDNQAHLHFTISNEHQRKFNKRHQEVQKTLEAKTNVKFHLQYSFQKKETDTIAATLEDTPFLDENGDMIFRPSGHGALLENLNGVDADIVFIKNIDNVVSEKQIETIAFHKKVLAGKLLELREKIFQLVEKLIIASADEATIDEALNFVTKELKLSEVKKDRQFLLKILNRPLRVCGVVENTGAPGGGPFLVRHANGEVSFQIVEMSQINLDDPLQKALVEQATHFNPVDLVCCIKDYLGKKFNLLEFSDPNTGFISQKSYQGKPIKALERPGLWNGSMAHWNTVFVEVPLETFNPVKTVNDLLNEVHQL